MDERDVGASHSIADAGNSAQLNHHAERLKPQEEAMAVTDQFEIEEPAGSLPRTSVLFSRGVQLYCLAMLCGSLMKATSKLLVRNLNPFIVVFARMLFTASISMVVMRLKRVDHYFWGQRDVCVLLFVRGWLGFFNICLTYFALMYLSLPDLAVISFLTPLTTCVAARLFLGEQYHWQQALASCVSLVGVLIIARPAWLFGSTGSVPGDDGSDVDPESARHIAMMRSLAIFGALFVVCTASAVMIILRKIADRAHALASVSNYAVMSVFGSLVGILCIPSSERKLPDTPKMWGVMSLMGVFGFMLQYLSSKAIQLEEATVLSNFKYTQLLYATTLEFLLWHDVPDWISFCGIALILVGVVWTARSRKSLSAKKIIDKANP